MSAASTNTGAMSNGFAAGLLERKLDDWALQIRADVEPGHFLREWLKLAVHTARADAAGVWLLGADQHWTRLGLSIDAADGQSQTESLDTAPDVVLQCLTTDEPQISRGRFDGLPITRGLCRVRQGGQPVGVLDVRWQAELFQSAEGTLIPFLGASGELLGDFLVQHELRQLRREHTQWRQWEQFLTAAQQQTTLMGLAQSIAHDGRGLTGADRISVVRRNGGRWEVAAVSGVDTIDPRSSTVQSLEHLARELSRLTRSKDSADRLEAAYARLHQTTTAQAAIAKPLKTATGEVVGVIVSERFEATPDSAAWEQRCRSLQQFATAPWVAAFEAEQSLWSRWRRRVAQRWGVRHLVPLIGLALLGGVGATLAITPADLRITAEGTLLPELRRDVFAGTSGIVAAVLVDHGDAVTQGQELIELRDPATDQEATRIAGDLATARARLNVIQAARISAITSTNDGQAQAQQLAAEEAELKQRLDSLVAQQALLEQERAATKVTSPLAGEVLTWDVASLLSGRPVERGQVLLTVGDVSGPWIVEAHIRERDIQELRDAQADSETNLPVEFSLAAKLSQAYVGRVTEIARVADVNERGETTVRVTIAFDRRPDDLLRPGSTVLPKIHCGERSLGYVWFRELIYAVRRQWWLTW